MHLNLQHVTKINAARAQLDEAIQLFFEARSPIAVHTLVMAAHQLLHDYTGRSKSMLKNERTIREFGKERIHRYNEEFNFFKHSVDDKDKVLNFDTELHTYFLIDAIYLFAAATGEWPHSHKVFNLWFILKRPHMVEAPEASAAVAQAKLGGWSHENLKVFLRLIHEPALFGVSPVGWAE